jgi:hypothetical protein
MSCMLHSLPKSPPTLKGVKLWSCTWTGEQSTMLFFLSEEQKLDTKKIKATVMKQYVRNHQSLMVSKNCSPSNYHALSKDKK